LKHPESKVRILACIIFSETVQNNIEVQQFALKFGALNMMTKFVHETELKNKEALAGALSSFLRSENFLGKQ